MALSETVKSVHQKYELLDPDVRLMLQVREGDAAAFEQLVEKYQARLIGILGHVVNRDQAEDLAQEVFMRIYRARKNYVPGAKFSTWLYTIAQNVASNAIRRLARRMEVNLTNSPSGLVPIRPLEKMAAAKSGLMPTRQTDRKEMQVIVQQAINSLGDRQRMVLLLAKFEGMSYEEIAEAMQMTPQAVKSLLSRARANLRQALEPYLESGQLPQGGYVFDVPSGHLDPRDTGELKT